MESLGKINSATKHKYALQVLDGYKSVKTALEAIDLDHLKGLELYLRQRGNKDNSIATRFAIFKAIYNKAVKEGKVTVKQNPFTLFRVSSFQAKEAVFEQPLLLVTPLHVLFLKHCMRCKTP